MTLLTIPGPVDPHVHLRDLDWPHKGTVASETAAALAGGYWAVLDMPNTPPPTTTPARLARKSELFQRSARCDFGLYFGADQAGNERHYPGVAASAAGLKMYCDETTGELLVSHPAARESHMTAWRNATRRPLAVHAEGGTLAQVCELAVATHTPTHFCHVSAADEVELLRQAKRAGAPISVGVTPHHLYLTMDDAARLGAFGHVKPALKTSRDVAALWAGIDDGTVDVVESDHAPHARSEKDSAQPPAGLPGLETTMPLLGLAVHEGRITEQRLIEQVSEAARRIWGLRLPDDTSTTLDLGSAYEIRDETLLTSPGWSPFAGMLVWGVVREVRIRGRVAFDGERVLAGEGDGAAVTWS